MTRKFLASIMVLALVATVVGVAANAAETEVSATVTSELVSVSVSTGQVLYGVLRVNTSKDTVALVQTQTVTNTSNVAVDLEVKSSDAVGGNNWDLVAAVGSVDQFTHEFSPNGVSSWTSFNVDNDVYASLASDVAAGDPQSLDLRIKTPTSVSDIDVQKTITVTVLASASQ